MAHWLGTATIGVVVMLIGIAAAWLEKGGTKKRVKIILDTVAAAFFLMCLWLPIAMMIPVVAVMLPFCLLSDWTKEN
ncbi:MAG: hypothetical protein AXW12_00640 [Thalassospira sp. Nap_22]|nr:MAG: hypothetical protein AXW12_00640 [Thalassospira sp. Nap_22]